MRRFHHVRWTSAFRVFAVAATAAGCGDADAGGDAAAADEACVAGAPPSCDPLYVPTFDALYTRRLATGCATSSVCHGSGSYGPLVFEDADTAWAGLVEGGRVLPGRPACGVLIDRLTSTDPTRRMPPGGALSAAELCVVQQWIGAGAER